MPLHDHAEHTPKPQTAPGLRGSLVVPACLALLIVVGGRVLGPSDLYQNSDQCRTAAFTADMVYNARWLIPVDLEGQPTLKPPLYNWLGAPALALGWHTETAYKLPALMAGLMTMAGCIVAGMLLFRGLAHRTESDGVDRAIGVHAPWMGLVAGIAWLASPSAVKHIYFARPDGLQDAMLTLGFVGAILLLTRPDPPRWAAALLWISAGLAALAKGPMALLLPAYLLLGLVLLRPGAVPARRRLGRAGLVWGVPLMLALPAAWLIPAWIVDAQHVGSSLLAGEVGERLSTGGDGLGRLPMNAVRVPAFFFERFWPWAFAAVVALWIMRPRRWLNHPLGPAVLWIGLLTGVLIVAAGESGSFNAPAYPAMAVLAVYAIVRVVAQNNPARVGMGMVACAWLAVVVAGVLIGREHLFSRAAQTGLGEQLAWFAEQAGEHVGRDAVAFVDLGQNPVPLLMGRHPGTRESRTKVEDARWVICPLIEGVEPVVGTGPLTRTRAGGRGVRSKEPGIGLYRSEQVLGVWSDRSLE